MKYSNKILFICLGLLILVLVPGIGTIRNGSRSWFGIGGLGIQPSEFMKLALSGDVNKADLLIKDISKSFGNKSVLNNINIFFL